MPDPDDSVEADEETIPETSLHAYKEAREDEVKGDPDTAATSDDEEGGATPKH